MYRRDDRRQYDVESPRYEPGYDDEDDVGNVSLEVELDSRDRLPSEQSGSELDSWAEPPTDKPEQKVADTSSGEGRRRFGKFVPNQAAGSVRTKGASKAYDDAGEGTSRRGASKAYNDAGEGTSRRGVVKRPAGADSLGPKQKRELPDLRAEVERNKAERKNDRRGLAPLSDEDIGRISNSVAVTLKPMIEEKIREAVRESVKSLNTAQKLWQTDSHNRIKDMLASHKRDLMDCIRKVDTEMQQMVATTAQQKTSYMVQSVQTAMTDNWESSSTKLGQQVGQQVESVLAGQGTKVQEAISEMAQKEAEVQRHLSNIFSELSEIRRRINNDLPAAAYWQLQQAGTSGGAEANNGVMMVSGGVQVTGGVEMEVAMPADGPAVAAEVAVANDTASAVNDAVMVAVGGPVTAAASNAVMAATVGVSAEVGGGALNTPPPVGEGEEGLEAGVNFDVGSPSEDIDPSLLDQPDGW